MDKRSIFLILGFYLGNGDNERSFSRVVARIFRVWVVRGLGLNFVFVVFWVILGCSLVFLRFSFFIWKVGLRVVVSGVWSRVKSVCNWLNSMYMFT